MVVVSVSEQGLKRTTMEDYIYPDVGRYEVTKFPYLFAVADGVAGNPFGEKASRAAIELLVSYYDFFVNKKKIPPSKSMLKSIFDSIQEGLEFIEHIDKTVRGSATTLSVGIVTHDAFIYGYAGDSPIYLFRKKSYKRLDSPHIIGKWYLYMGTPLLNQSLVNCMGGYSGSSSLYKGATVGQIPIMKGDYLFIASDGVTLHMSPSEIRDLLFSSKTIEEVSDIITDVVYQKGAMDNFSFVVVEV